MEIKERIYFHSYHTAVPQGKELHRYALSFNKVTYAFKEAYLAVQLLWCHLYSQNFA